MWIELESAEALAAQRVGGKSAGVARLAQAGLPVPRGWCLPVEAEPRVAVDELLAALSQVDEQVWRRPAALLRARLAIASAGEALRNAADCLWARARGPVAVRSSAVLESGEHPASLSGQLSTFLGVEGAPALLSAIHACWLSRWSDSVIRYALGHRLDLRQLRMGVLVQPMVDARSAGSAHVIGGQVTIEGCWGLGRGVADAEVVPDQWLVVDGEIRECRVGHKPLAAGPDGWQRLSADTASRLCLDAAVVVNLARLVREAAAVCGAPVEVEWAVDDDHQLWLLQTRPLGTTEATPLAPAAWADAYVDGLPASGGQAIGRARVVQVSRDLQRLDPAEVLVAGHLEPGALAGVGRLAGLVLEAGGTTSHAAALARERGIPAVLGARGATHVIADGSDVLVDGDRGRVWLSAPRDQAGNDRDRARPLVGHPAPPAAHD